MVINWQARILVVASVVLIGAAALIAFRATRIASSCFEPEVSSGIDDVRRSAARILSQVVGKLPPADVQIHLAALPAAQAAANIETAGGPIDVIEASDGLFWKSDLASRTIIIRSRNPGNQQRLSLGGSPVDLHEEDSGDESRVFTNKAYVLRKAFSARNIQALPRTGDRFWALVAAKPGSTPCGVHMALGPFYELAFFENGKWIASYTQWIGTSWQSVSDAIRNAYAERVGARVLRSGTWPDPADP